MKTLKITLTLLALLLLTVSGVKSEDAVNQNEPNYKEGSIQINLLAHKKDKLKVPSNG